MALVSLKVSREVPPPEAFGLQPPEHQRLHCQLVERAGRWLKGKGCQLVLREFVAAMEIPDAIGWRGTTGHSYLIECKTTRSDFHKEKLKPWRIDPGAGMGDYRYILCPPGVVKPADLAPGWGLLWAHRSVVTVEHGHIPGLYDREHRWRFERKNDMAEATMIRSALRRVQLHVGAQDFDRLIHATYASKALESRP